MGSRYKNLYLILPKGEIESVNDPYCTLMTVKGEILTVTRVCQHCGKEFTAFRTTTQCCSDHCAKRYYKTKKKAEKIEASNKQTFKVKIKPFEVLQAKDFLSVSETSQLLSCSTRTIRRLIDAGIINAVRFSTRKTIIRRKDIEILFYENSINP